jgi:hypothetical protein
LFGFYYYFDSPGFDILIWNMTKDYYFIYEGFF